MLGLDRNLILLDRECEDKREGCIVAAEVIEHGVVEIPVAFVCSGTEKGSSVSSR
jgi:hypothetical protein